MNPSDQKRPDRCDRPRTSSLDYANSGFLRRRMRPRREDRPGSSGPATRPAATSIRIAAEGRPSAAMQPYSPVTMAPTISDAVEHEISRVS